MTHQRTPRRTGRGRRATALFAGLIAVAGLARAATASAASPPAAAPDLGTVRYRDPPASREIWLGLDAGGVAIPRRLGLFDRRIWVARISPAWSVALTPWLALGGRHGIAWYEAAGLGSTARLRQHEHQLELSGRPLAASGTQAHRDRLAVGFSTHTIKKIDVNGASFRIGGLTDSILHLGYGVEHRLAGRWTLGWRTQLRHAWVFLNKQRHVRASARASFQPRPGHDLSAELLGYYVNRDADQAGTPLPRNTVHGQVAGEYTWIGRAGVGPALRARFATSYLGGEAPVYEIREEALNTYYGDVTLGLRVVWR